MKSPGFSAQPGQGEPIAGRDGRVSRAWANYFAQLASAQAGDDLRQLYEALAARVAELADGQALRIVGRNSVSAPSASVVEIQLVGDELTPGNTEYYGTGPDGAKGFYPAADAIEVDTADLDKVVGTDGVVTLGLADVPDVGGGTLQKTAFDSKGRKAGTSAATTDDLSEGGTNQYWKEAPADGKQYARQSAGWSEVSGSGTPLGPANAGPGIAIDASTPSTPIISSTVAGIALKGRVANHGALPASGNVSGDAYLNDADGRIYVWNGTAWPAPGAGVIVGRIGNQVLLAGHDTSTGSASASLFANKGSVWTTNEAVIIDSIVFRVDEVAGAQYRAGLYRLSSITPSSAVVAEVVGLATAVTAAATATRSRRFQFQSPVRMNPGSTYAFMHSRVDATASTSSGAQFLPTGTIGIASVLPVVDAVQACRNASNLPISVGNTVDLTTQPFRTSILGYFG